MPQNTISRYHFSVDWGGARTGFTEVSGLDIEVEAISQRDGSSPDDFFRKIPGLRKYPNLVLKREIARGDDDFFKWINTKKNGTIERRDITVSLLDEEHNPVTVWKVKNAFPVHYSGPVLLSNDGGLATEKLEITHEGIEVKII